MSSQVLDTLSTSHPAVSFITHIFTFTQLTSGREVRQDGSVAFVEMHLLYVCSFRDFVYGEFHCIGNV